MASASDKLLQAIEEWRASRRLTQASVAHRLGVSQAHYSKVVGGIVPLSDALAARMRDLIAGTGAVSGTRATMDEATRLSQSIQRDARRLVHLIRNGVG